MFLDFCANMFYTFYFTLFFFFNDTATTEIYTLSLHDALPIYRQSRIGWDRIVSDRPAFFSQLPIDRKSTRLNSSHPSMSYAVFCLKKKNAELCRVLHRLLRNAQVRLRVDSVQLAVQLTRGFFLNEPAPTEIYTLSLHDALPI